MMLRSERIYLRHLKLEDASELLALRQENKLFLAPVEPKRLSNYYTLEIQHNIITSEIDAITKNECDNYGIFYSENNKLIGKMNVTNIIRGSFENANIGYFLAEEYTGQGLAGEALQIMLKHVFSHIKLHRLQAAIMPGNNASKKLVGKMGFRFEGLAKSYLKIDDVWEDHEIYAITCEEWEKFENRCCK